MADLLRKALVRKSDGYVENVIALVEGAEYPLPKGYELRDAEGAVSPGYRWDGSAFVAPVVEPVTPSPTAEERLNLLEQHILAATTPDDLFQRLKTVVSAPGA